MKAFIFDYVDNLTERYHSGGGLVVIAENKDAVRRILTEQKYEDVKLSDDEWTKVIIYDLSGPVEPAVYIFPDAGCC